MNPAHIYKVLLQDRFLTLDTKTSPALDRMKGRCGAVQKLVSYIACCAALCHLLSMPFEMVATGSTVLDCLSCNSRNLHGSDLLGGLKVVHTGVGVLSDNKML
jgi:hypothetical protein